MVAERLSAQQRYCPELEAGKNARCTYCRVEMTTVRRRTGEITPCVKCKRIKVRAKVYGLSINDYFSMLRDQDGKCAICNVVLTTPCIDHCHDLNHVRGLLCTSCNYGIGAFKDDDVVLRAAIDYVNGNLTSRRWWFQKEHSEYM